MIGFGQFTYVPDDNFEQALINLGYDNILDDYVTTANINTVTFLAVNSNGIFNLTGIEDFTALTSLFCNSNGLTSLDISQNTTLSTLSCSSNQLTSLDVSQNTALTYLFCSGNQLNSLDVSNNTALTFLSSNQNQLTSLDVSNNPFLEELGCSMNQITNLDVTQNTNLLNMGCSHNLITELDVSACSLLYSLQCQNNNLNTLDLRNGTTISTNFAFNAQFNPNLNCIDVDDVTYAIVNWANTYPSVSFSLNCPPVVFGCTDTLSCNYNASANIDDGSCVYVNTSVSLSNVSCNGFADGSVVATANGGATPNYQYSLTILFSTVGLSQASGTFSNLTAGTYSLDVTDINGCSSNQIFTITEPNPLFVNAFSTDISCFGYCDGSAFSMPSGGTPPYSYLWSNGNITDNISGLCAGAYVVNITDANNCVNIETVVISEPPPSGIQQSFSICNGDSVIVGNSVYNTAGNYTDTLATTNGCDSIVYTNITMDYNTSSFDTLSVTASIVWNGMPLNASGDYSVTLNNLAGCDSIVNLNLTITTTGISDIVNTKSNLVKITDMLGQKTPYRRNTPLFYIYDNGTVEKRIVIE